MAKDHVYDESFRETPVTITIGEMADIIGNLASELCKPDDDDSIEDVMHNLAMLDLLNHFGAAIMTEMFEDVLDLEIESDDPEE